MLGFCDEKRQDDRLPGWERGSWGYHGDDGRLFVESSTGSEPTADFGDAGKFHSRDVVGCGLDMKTGEGFCTRNGKRLDMGTLSVKALDSSHADLFSGNAFETTKFQRGKIYPCIDFDVSEGGVGLHLQVNLGSSAPSHGFRYHEK